MSDFGLLREECLRAYLYLFKDKPAKCGMAARVRVPSPSRPTVWDKATQPPNRFCLAAFHLQKTSIRTIDLLTHQ